MIDAETMTLLRELGPATLPVVVCLIAWLELRAMPLLRRGIAGHRAVTRKMGVTDEDVAGELVKLRQPFPKAAA